MTLDNIFYIQLLGLLSYIGSVFLIYRLLVKQKDSTIELLKERNSVLKDRISELGETRPDIVVERMGKRLKSLESELERAVHEIKTKEDELDAANERQLTSEDYILELKSKIEDESQRIAKYSVSLEAAKKSIASIKLPKKVGHRATFDFEADYDWSSTPNPMRRPPPL